MKTILFFLLAAAAFAAPSAPPAATPLYLENRPDLQRKVFEKWLLESTHDLTPPLPEVPVIPITVVSHIKDNEYLVMPGGSPAIILRTLPARGEMKDGASVDMPMVPIATRPNVVLAGKVRDCDVWDEAPKPKPVPVSFENWIAWLKVGGSFAFLQKSVLPCPKCHGDQKGCPVCNGSGKTEDKKIYLASWSPLPERKK